MGRVPQSMKKGTSPSAIIVRRADLPIGEALPCGVFWLPEPDRAERDAVRLRIAREIALSEPDFAAHVTSRGAASVSIPKVRGCVGAG